MEKIESNAWRKKNVLKIFYNLYLFENSLKMLQLEKSMYQNPTLLFSTCKSTYSL